MSKQPTGSVPVYKNTIVAWIFHPFHLRCSFIQNFSCQFLIIITITSLYPTLLKWENRRFRFYGYRKEVRVRPRYPPTVEAVVCRDNLNGIQSVLQDWLTVIGTVILNNHLMKYSTYMGVLLYPVSAMIIGGRIRGLACLLHQSSHRCLARSKLLNDVLGSLFSGWSVLQSWTGYHHNHIVLHHPHLGDPDKDPDYQQIIQTGLYSKDTTKADVLKYIKSIPLPTNTLGYLGYIAKDRVFPKGEKRFETILRLCFWVIVIFTLYQTNSLQRLVIYWFIPLLTTANWIGNLVELLEHFPLLNKGLGSLHTSRNRLCGIVTDFFFNPHGDGYHLVHHMFPRMPHWNFKRAHEILMDDENYRQVNHGRTGMVAVVEEMLSHFD